MEKIKSKRKDTFRSFLVSGANFTDGIELPIPIWVENVPNELVSFENGMNATNLNRWVHFYTHDFQFERIWNNPLAYIERLKKYQGVISTDFSLYREMPLCMQQWNTYRSRALAYWFSANGIQVIPNVRWGDERTYDFCFNGLPKNSVVAVGTHGCIKKSIDRYYFKLGLSEMIDRLSPHTIIVYGSAPESLFSDVHKADIKVISFESEFSKSRNQVTA